MTKVKNPHDLLRRVVVVMAVGAFALASVALSGSAGATQAPRVTMKTSAHTVSTSGSFTLTARTVHKIAGTDVVLQEKRASGWQNVLQFSRHAGGRIRWSKPSKGDHRLRALLEKQGQTLDVSPVVVVHVTAPKPVKTPAPVHHSCTRTSTGSCIRGGEFCKQSMYGQTGYDAGGRSWVCTGDHTHPHWE